MLGTEVLKMVRNTTERVLVGSVYSQKIDRNSTNKENQVKKSQEVKTLDRVSQIKEQIQNGTYELDMKKTSEKMALNLLNL